MGTNGVSQENNPYLGQPPDHQMVFEAQEIADIDISAISTTGMMSKDSNGKLFPIRFAYRLANMARARIELPHRLRHLRKPAGPGTATSALGAG